MTPHGNHHLSFCPRPLSGPNVSGFSPTQKNTILDLSNGRPPSDGQLPTEHAGLNHPLVIPDAHLRVIPAHPPRHSCAPFVFPAKAGIQRGRDVRGYPIAARTASDAARRPGRARTARAPSFPRKRESRGVRKRGYPIAASTASTRPGAPARSHTHHRLSRESGNPEGSGRGATPSPPARPPPGPAPRRARTHITVFPAKAGIQRGQEEGLPHRRQHGLHAARRPGALAHSSPSFPRKRESRGVGKRGYPMAAHTASTRHGAPARSHTYHRLSRESGNPEGSGRGATPSPPARPPRGPAPRRARTWRGSWPSSPAPPPRPARPSAPPPSPRPAGRHGAPSTCRGCP